MKIKIILALIIVLSVGVWALTTFTGSLTSYVSFDEAQRRGKRVQVMGEILHDEVSYDAEGHLLRFPIEDDAGTIMEVSYAGVMPGNFDQATHVVCQGRYDGQAFQADQLLVKCPSKYLGEEAG